MTIALQEYHGEKNPQITIVSWKNRKIAVKSRRSIFIDIYCIQSHVFGCTV